MPKRLRAKISGDNNTIEATDPLTVETTYNGQTLAWGPGQVRAFGDDGVAQGHSRFARDNNHAVFVDNALVTVSDSRSETVTERV